VTKKPKPGRPTPDADLSKSNKFSPILPQELADRLRKYKAGTGVNINRVFEFAIKAYLDQKEKEAGK